jgi:hypothetical protein
MKLNRRNADIGAKAFEDFYLFTVISFPKSGRANSESDVLFSLSSSSSVDVYLIFLTQITLYFEVVSVL